MSQNPGSTSYTPSELKLKLQRELAQFCQSKIIQTIIEALGPDAELHLVGGLIRNIALDKKPGDIDLASILEPEEAIRRLELAELSTYTTGMEHGTITINIDGQNIELTTFRKAGPRNICQFSKTIEEDLQGRDFTVNALAFNPVSEELIDPFNGLGDLIESKLNAVGEANDRLEEDPLRILRMIRFGPAMGFTVSEDLKEASKNLLINLDLVSIERVQVELSKILLSSSVRSAFDCMLEIGILERILPEILPSVDFEQNEFHIEDVYQHSMTVLENAAKKPQVRLAALFHDLGKPESLSVGEDGRRHFYNHEKFSADIAKSVMTRLKYPKALTKSVVKLVGFHMRPLACGPAGVRRLLRDLAEDFKDWMLLKQADRSPTVSDEDFRKELNDFVAMLIEEKQRQSSPVYGKLAINGNDLIKLGLEPGEELGNILKQIEELVIEDPDLNQESILINKAKEFIKNT